MGTSFVITDPVPANTDFKVGSDTADVGATGLTAAAAYSPEGGAACDYTPSSAAGGAPAASRRTVPPGS